MSPVRTLAARAAAALVLATASLTAAAPAAQAQAQHGDSLLTVGHYLDMESVADPQLSPDGTRIVYTRRWVNTVEDRFDTELWLMNADGSHKRRLVKGSSPVWS
ncbi:MAG TPA: hypothetical protein VFL93_07935, partial [Longimicrobiaceae bacterium]|nr:hypothetical protein [Longimicrobiaceae bacterium]